MSTETPSIARTILTRFTGALSEYGHVIPVSTIARRDHQIRLFAREEDLLDGDWCLEGCQPWETASITEGEIIAYLASKPYVLDVGDQRLACCVGPFGIAAPYIHLLWAASTAMPGSVLLICPERTTLCGAAVTGSLSDAIPLAIAAANAFGGAREAYAAVNADRLTKGGVEQFRAAGVHVIFGPACVFDAEVLPEVTYNDEGRRERDPVPVTLLVLEDVLWGRL